MERYTIEQESKKLVENEKVDFAFSNATQLELFYPKGTVLDAIVTSVYDVPQLRFFMFTWNAANAHHFARVCHAANPPNAYECLSLPREGYVFALRLGGTAVLRAVRLPTMCITNIHKVFLMDIGREYILNDEPEMYHLPATLRKPPGLAVQCQLRGVNDDVTILPKNMRDFLKGLLFRNVKLRVDGYNGNILKVQLLDVTMDKLLQWTAERGEEEHDLTCILKNIVLYKSANIVNESHSHVALSPIAEICQFSDDERINNNVSTSSTLPALPNSSSVDQTALSTSSFVANEDMCVTGESNLVNTNENNDDLIKKILLNGDHLNEKTINKKRTISPEKADKRPLLGGHTNQILPILDGVRPIIGILQTSDKFWKKDVLPALTLVDNRHINITFPRYALLTITPTYIGQLERFFGVVHRRNECYMQHMWTDDKIPFHSRYTNSHSPYIFDIVLARHGADFNWYRAKVIEICTEKRKVLVFFVDYGGVEYVELCNLANLGRSIAKLPFQAVLFRLHNLVDVTTTKVDRAYGVGLMRKMLLKKTLTVRVVNNTDHEVVICFRDDNFSYVYPTLIRKGLMQHLGTM